MTVSSVQSALQLPFMDYTFWSHVKNIKNDPCRAIRSLLMWKFVCLQIHATVLITIKQQKWLLNDLCANHKKVMRSEGGLNSQDDGHGLDELGPTRLYLH